MTGEPGRADPLGNIASIASTITDGRSRRYFLQSIARELLPTERVSFCHRRPFGKPEIWFNPNYKKSHYAKLVTCGSCWHDPVCAAKITERKRQELRQAEIRLAQDRYNQWGELEHGIRYTAFMTTFTSAHNLGDDYMELIADNNQAFREIKSGRWWIEFEKEYSIIGSIAGTETTYGEENGWHFHKHVNFLSGYDKADIPIEAINEALTDRWHNACKNNGRYTSALYGVEVSKPLSTWDDYFAKWGLSSEVTKYSNKLSRKDKHQSYTPFDLLDLAGAGSQKAKDLFVEYAFCIKGRNQLVYSRGLRKILGMDVEKTDEELASEPVEVGESLLATLSLEEWKTVLSNDARGELLAVADSGDPLRIQSFLARLRPAARTVNFGGTAADPAPP